MTPEYSKAAARTIAALAMMLPWLCVSASQSPNLISRKSFAATSTMSGTRLSPNGEYVAYIASDGNSAVKVASTRCKPLCSEGALHVPLEMGARPQMVFWTSASDALVISFTSPGGGMSVSRYEIASRVLRSLVFGPTSTPHFISSSGAVFHALPQLVFRTKEGTYQRIDPTTGAVERVSASHGITPVARSLQGQVEIGYRYSRSGRQEWLVINDANAKPLTAFGQEDLLLRSLLVSSYEREGRQVALFLDSSQTDVVSLTEIETETGKRSILASGRADIRNVLLDGVTGKPEAYATEYLKPEWHPLVEGLGASIGKLTQLGRGFPEILDRGRNGLWLVRFSGPGAIPGHYLYDTGTGELRQIDRLSSPGPSGYSESLPFEVTTSDGLQLVGYFTPPFGKTCTGDEACALVVLLHGGPRTRDRLGSATYHQLLANRGYAVMSVNYRGSRGFGKRFEALGEGEWGGASQEDVMEGLRWVLKNKRIQEDRVAVMGSSHGGYLALNSVKTAPQSFRCAIGIAATANLVTFVQEVVRATPGYAGDLHKSVGNPNDPAQRAVMLQRSPSEYVDRFKQTHLLLIHGGKDTMSPLRDVKEFAESVNAAGGKALFVEFPDEGHAFRKGEADETLTYLVEAFLADCLGGEVEARANQVPRVPLRVSGAATPSWIH